ncbi:MAG: SPOR domain-containing protein [Stellaceae bacterium]
MLLPPLLAAGCAVPPAVTIASFAADGVSYLTTGKSVTDHGISIATGHDCALLRPVFADKPVCDTTLTAHAKEVPVEIGQAATTRPSLAAAAPVPEPAPVAGTRYVTVGSFLNPDNAARAASRYAGLTVTVVPAEIQGRHFHRVVVGPLSGEAAAALKLQLVAQREALSQAGASGCPCNHESPHRAG